MSVVYMIILHKKNSTDGVELYLIYIVWLLIVALVAHEDHDIINQCGQ